MDSSESIQTMLSGHHAETSDRVKKIIPDTHLLQAAAILGEEPVIDCLKKIDLLSEIGTDKSLLGKAEKSYWFNQEWELKYEKQKPGLTFKLERKYLRNGYYVYRTKSSTLILIFNFYFSI